MGNPKRSVSRSSDTISKRVKTIDKEDRVKKRKGKRHVEKSVRDKFERNIVEQSTEVSKETDQIFKSSIKSPKKPKIIADDNLFKKVLDKKFGDKIENSLGGLADILKVPDSKVDKDFTNLKSDDEKKNVDFFKPKVEFKLDVEPAPTEEDLGVPLKGDADTVAIVEEDMGDSYTSYNYTTIKSLDLTPYVIPKKRIRVAKSLNDPDYLYGSRYGETRVCYVEKIHPLYKKILEKLDSRVNRLFITEGSLNSLLFKTALEKVYHTLEDCYLTTESCFRIVTKEYQADVVLSDLILDYQDTAYYVLLETKGRSEVELKNMILINVDIIFSV